MTIRNFLWISTAHLDETARDFLDQEVDWSEYPGAGVFPMGPGEGWMLWVPADEPINSHLEGLARRVDADDLGSLPAVMRYAASQDVPYIWLTPDADAIDALPTFNW